eukprot:5601787-Pyramimonas_sp.AAC.1
MRTGRGRRESAPAPPPSEPRCACWPAPHAHAEGLRRSQQQGFYYRPLVGRALARSSGSLGVAFVR